MRAIFVMSFLALCMAYPRNMVCNKDYTQNNKMSANDPAGESSEITVSEATRQTDGNKVTKVTLTVNVPATAKGLIAWSTGGSLTSTDATAVDNCDTAFHFGTGQGLTKTTVEFAWQGEDLSSLTFYAAYATGYGKFYYAKVEITSAGNVDTAQPTAEPTLEPTAATGNVDTAQPTAEPTSEPTAAKPCEDSPATFSFNGNNVSICSTLTTLVTTDPCSLDPEELCPKTCGACASQYGCNDLTDDALKERLGDSASIMLTSCAKLGEYGLCEMKVNTECPVSCESGCAAPASTDQPTAAPTSEIPSSAVRTGLGFAVTGMLLAQALL